ncbi:hypothetical protein ACA910_001301 [Epithemia clementina (nom. ined.)]
MEHRNNGDHDDDPAFFGQGFTQADCVEWDESKNIDLRALGSPDDNDNQSPRFCFDDDDDEEVDDNQENEDGDLEEDDGAEGYGKGNKNVPYDSHGSSGCASDQQAMMVIDDRFGAALGPHAKRLSYSGDEENALGVVHHHKRRRKRRRNHGELLHAGGQGDWTPLVSLKSSSLTTKNKNDNRRLSTSSNEGGGNKALAALLKQVSTPASTCPKNRPLSTSMSGTATTNPVECAQFIATPATSSRLDHSETSDNNKQHDTKAGEDKHVGLSRNNAATPPPTDAFVVSSTATNSPNIVVEDEFDMVDLSMADLAEIDNLVQLATQQAPPYNSNGDANNILTTNISNNENNKMNTTNSQQTSNTCRSKPPEQKSTITTYATTVSRVTSIDMKNKSHALADITHFLHKQKQRYISVPSKVHTGSLQTETAKPISQVEQSIEEDEFDFPDLDFDEIDKNIAKRVSGTMPKTSDLTIGKPLSELSDDELFAMVPSQNIPVANKIITSEKRSGVSRFLTFDRFQVVRVRVDVATYTKILVVACWNDSMLINQSSTKNSQLDSLRPFQTQQKGDGLIFLRGEWFHSMVEEGDVINICSITGQFETGLNALPLIMHTTPPAKSVSDDLVLVVHPDILLTPTTISETVSCTRLAVLKNRLGSTGFSSLAPLFGTMRHELFQECLRAKNFSKEFVKNHIDLIVRRNAEGLVGCNVSSHEAKTELLKVLPQMHKFISQFTNLGEKRPHQAGDGRLERHGSYPAVRFLVDKVESVEESLVSHELGLIGSADVIVTATTAKDKGNGKYADPSTSLVCIELKTGHLQSAQSAHMAQLALYTLMAHTRFGSTATTAHGSLGTGALLYINNEGLHAIHVAPHIAELKSLIGQRNSVASEQVLALKPRGVELPAQVDADPAGSAPRAKLLPAPPAKLPGLVASAHSCRRCYMSKECMTYAGAERLFVGEQSNSIYKKHGELIEKASGHLSGKDFEYFQKWDRLIDLEVHCTTISSANSWLIPSSERERATGKCVSALVFEAVELSSPTQSSPSIVRLKRSHSSTLTTSLLALGLERGCHAILSTDDTSLSKSRKVYRAHMHIMRGILDRVTDQNVFLRASSDDVARLQKLMARSKDGKDPIHFRLDRDEVATGAGTLRQNLINLFAGCLNEDATAQKRTQRNAQIRRLLVRLERPIFDERLSFSMFSTTSRGPPTTVPGCDMERLAEEFCDLNPDQQVAAKRVIASRDYALIQGLPGTGKTSTIAFVVRLLVAHGQRVLITSYTHSAVDNVLLKLIESGLGKWTEGSSPSLVRVGQKMSCHQAVTPYLATEIAALIEEDQTCPTEKAESPRPESLKRVMMGARVVGATALSVPRSPLLSVKDFDVVIVDEAGQINQPAIIGALQAAGRFVLVGDHMQLPPLVQSELAEDGGFGESMLKRLAENHPSSVSRLTLQYRMAESICQLSNDIIYGGILRCANESVAKRRLSISTKIGRESWDSWIRKATEPGIPAVFVDTDNRGSKSNEGSGESLERKVSRGGAVVNDTESSVVKTLVHKFACLGVDVASIGVICPYRAQIRILEDDPMLAKLRKDGLELSTIDRYQGRDKDVIILSLVRSNDKGRVGRLLSDARRLSVAVTRARKKLVMVGSFSTLSLGSQALRPALDRIKRDGGVVSFKQS